MQTKDIDRKQPKKTLYKDLAASLAALLEGETDALANLSNASALLSQAMDRINWCGVYLMRKGELVLGPFQGKPACVRIPVGKGVCGTAAARRETIVVPIVEGRKLHGVLDVDSPDLNRFDAEDRKGLEGFVAVLVPRIEWKKL